MGEAELQVTEPGPNKIDAEARSHKARPLGGGRHSKSLSHIGGPTPPTGEAGLQVTELGPNKIDAETLSHKARPHRWRPKL